MPVQGFLQRLFARRPSAEPAATPEPEERRQQVVRCSGCKAWTSELVYLSNGGHYCLPCAQVVHGWSRARPVGRRAEDLSVLPESDTDVPHVEESPLAS